MTKKSKINKFVCIHGHFYQPPRENPYTGEIPVEESASPFHDWNERIFQECYKPNTEAIIVDAKGKVKERVNNYEYINFNFGPTLAEWIIKEHKTTFDKIVEADKESIKHYNGHGNAIAQIFNHIIMPLANRRDKVTQVKWGVKFFEKYFERKPESIWLAETGCNYETIEVLIEEGIKYIILDPSQSLKVRKIGGKEWVDVSDNSINTKQPYRCFLKNSKKYIDIFFYDGPISKSIAFDDIAFSSEKLMSRIEQATGMETEKPQLISLAVDGETFGHHKKFSDRTIAYLLKYLVKIRGFKITNFGEYLEMFPPEYEVVLKPGEFDEGTSWSCVHGVGRWKRDCGCSTGGEFGWNQKWREPLRNSLNGLRDKLSAIYEIYGRGMLKDVWIARNDYIELMLDRSDESQWKYFERNASKVLTKDEKELCLNLLEMEKLALYMFTSCGWFFNDLNGLETKKILQYAQRAIDLGEKISGLDLKTDFLEELSKAKSNEIPSGTKESLNGKQIFLNLNNK